MRWMAMVLLGLVIGLGIGIIYNYEASARDACIEICKANGYELYKVEYSRVCICMEEGGGLHYFKLSSSKNSSATLLFLPPSKN